MRRGTTPTLVLNLSADLSSFARVVVTLKGDKQVYDFEDERLTLEEKRITLTLTQEETLTLGKRARVQVRAVAQDGTAVASTIATVPINQILKDGVLEVDDG